MVLAAKLCAFTFFDEAVLPYLIKHIITRLSGRALGTVQDKDVGG